MMQRSLSLLPLLFLSTLAAAPPSSEDAQRWWSHVEYLASDALQGRETGSEGHQKAAEYIAARWAEAGVQPAGTQGFFQPVQLESLIVDEAKSAMSWVREGKVEPLTFGKEFILSARNGQEAAFEAPLFFAGYCLSAPESRHDDFAGIDLKGKVAVCFRGGPKKLTPTALAHASSTAVRAKALAAAGALGIISLPTPHSLDIPWERIASSRTQPAMVFADPALREGQELRLGALLNPADAEPLFQGTGQTFEALVQRADAGKSLPRFSLPLSVRVKVALKRAKVSSTNVVGVLPGTDPKLREEYVVLSAHFDHVGVGAPIKGDAIYNGAMDNASGIATLIEVAKELSTGERKRSILLVAVTGEEKGLLGSRAFAVKPSVAGRMVANVNMDMYLPLHPLKKLVAYGMEESNLRAPLEAAAKAAGLGLEPDREPQRVLFVRSDQYSFVRVGVPALAFKFAAAPGTAEEAMHKAWYTERYHAPADDLTQPMDKEAAVRFNHFLGDFSRRVANAAKAPAWNKTSFFRRFVEKPDRP